LRHRLSDEQQAKVAVPERLEDGQPQAVTPARRLCDAGQSRGAPGHQRVA
jgi:hypothetical protein